MSYSLRVAARGADILMGADERPRQPIQGVGRDGPRGSWTTMLLTLRLSGWVLGWGHRCVGQGGSQWTPV